jgi:hypothetical protein
MPSYWKATTSPKITVEAGYLNKTQLNWWHDLFIQGMGQYFYENKIKFTAKNFLTITSTGKNRGLVYAKNQPNRILVPIGGGKDAIVTYEILKNVKQAITPFVLNPTNAQKALVQNMGKDSSVLPTNKPIVVQRTIDPKLLALNQKEFLN